MINKNCETREPLWVPRTLTWPMTSAIIVTAIVLDPSGAARRLGSLAAGAPADHAGRGQDHGGARLLPHRRCPTPRRGRGNELIGVQRLHELGP